MFHVWCGYVCIASAVSRRVWMRLDDSEIYPNIYALLVGGAGNGKTWALRKAKKILVELDLPYSASVETPQGMWRYMTGDDSNEKKPLPPYGGEAHKLLLQWPNGLTKAVHPMTIVASEFINFISLDDSVWINALNDIYDEDLYHYRTKNMGSDYIEGPCINMIGGLTTQVASALQKQNILNTGLARRTLLQYGERQWNNPHDDPIITPEQLEARSRVVDHLRKVKSIPCGEMKMTDAAKRWWKEWYGPNLAAVPTRPAATQSWYGTKASQMKKLAMLTSLSERLDYVIDVHHLEIPLAFLARLESGLYHIFGGASGSQMSETALVIYNYLCIQKEPKDFNTIKFQNWNSIPHAYGPDKVVKECLDYLCGTDKIKQAAFTVNNLTRVVYATPETFQSYVSANAAINVVRADESQNG